jgi:hypothetical protein
MSLRITENSNSAEDILSRIVKMAPSEVVGLYLLGKGAIPTDAPASTIGIWSVICLLLVLVLRIWGTKSQWPAVIVSFLSFGIWVLGIGDPLLSFSLQGYIVSLLILVFTFVVPIFYKPAS